MKRTKIDLSKKLLLSKENIIGLNAAQRGQIAGGASERVCRATQEDACRTLGLGIDLTQCCPVYELSVNLPCNA